VFRRLLLAFLALTVALLAGLALFLSGAARARLLEGLEHRLGADLEILRVSMRGGEPAVSVRRLGEALAVRLTVVGADGRVLADSQADPASAEDHTLRPEILTARERGRGTALRRSATVGEELVYVAEPLDPAAPRGTILRAAVSTARIDQEVSELRSAALAGFAVLALAALGFSALAARRLAAPLREIRDAAEAMASGDLARKAPIGERDEVGALASSLNRLADELSAQLDRLREERSRLEAALSGMDEGVFALDREGRILHGNAPALPLFGLTRDPAGLRVWEAVRLPGLERAVEQVMRDGVAFRGSWEVGPRSLSLRIAPVAGGRGTVLVARDVTEDRRYDALRREFVANASHELRTPLTMVQGYVETLLETDAKEEERVKEFLGIVDRNVRRLGAIVQDLLDLSKLESGGDVVSRQELDLAALLERVREQVEPAARGRKQSLLVETAGAGSVEADPVLLERALTNLADNAVKYTPEGGVIRLSALREPGRALLRVSDTGIGIPPEDQARIFERFYRVDKSRSRDMGGTGLGLSIVKHVAQLHGGEVTVESAPGKGSTFTLSFPVRT
jgi:two-component system phosphate regulon sensor histidine kinase PhoR